MDIIFLFLHYVFGTCSHSFAHLKSDMTYTQSCNWCLLALYVWLVIYICFYYFSNKARTSKINLITAATFKIFILRPGAVCVCVCVWVCTHTHTSKLEK